MSRKKICFIAQFPPPIHGLSKAVETLYNSELANEFEFEKVDITDNKKFIENLILILRSKADLFYFTISQSKGGNIRDLIIFKLLELQKKKCLIHLHGGYYRKLVDNELSSFWRKLNYNVVSKLDGVIVLSKALKGIFQGMIADERIFTVPNCIDDEFMISNEELKEKLKFIEEKSIIHVLYLSNFIKTKGYQETLELARAEKECCDCGKPKRMHFDFAGKFFEDREKENFFLYIKENGLEDFVTYHGVVDGEQKRLLLKECDIFVLLTRYINEGQPISILEAMGNGMVVITTNHAGIPDMVADGVNGFVFSHVDTDCIYQKLSLISRENLIEIAVNNRNRIQVSFKEEIYLNNMKSCFQKLLSEDE